MTCFYFSTHKSVVCTPGQIHGIANYEFFLSYDIFLALVPRYSA